MQRMTLGRVGAFVLIVCIALGLIYDACRNDSGGRQNSQPPAAPAPAVTPVDPPTFNADSAYYFVKKQVSFGPRVPNTKAHQQAASWIADEFRRLGLTVIEQRFQARHFKGEVFNGVNIIAQYKPESPRRILFGAHWDSRYIADQDVKDQNKPILGADDGASGVAVMLELARLLQSRPLDIGVDFICFDLEDQGNDSNDGQDNSETWCLGAQHWAKNPHRPGYSPQYAILLDMVGAANPRFAKEGISMQVAPNVVNKVWGVAASLGYGHAFVNEEASGITDDHLFVIKYARIPMINIINRPGETKSGFVPHWHTHNDNLDAIDPNTLRMVGEVCAHVIYRAHNGTL